MNFFRNVDEKNRENYDNFRKIVLREEDREGGGEVSYVPQYPGPTDPFDIVE